MRNRSRLVVMVLVWGLILIMLIWVLSLSIGLSSTSIKKLTQCLQATGALAAISPTLEHWA